MRTNLMRNPSFENYWVINDGFESGDTSAWGGVATNGGNLSITSSAAINGNYGLNLLINNGTDQYVGQGIGPNKRYRSRFYVDINSLTMQQYSNLWISAVNNASWSKNVTGITLEDSSTNGTGYQIGYLWFDNAQSVHNTYYNVSNGVHYIEVDWQAASASGANDGFSKVWIDGTQVFSDTAQNTDTLDAGSLQFGTFYWWGGTYSGTLHLDDYAGNTNGTPIGTASSSAPSGIDTKSNGQAGSVTGLTHSDYDTAHVLSGTHAGMAQSNGSTGQFYFNTPSGFYPTIGLTYTFSAYVYIPIGSTITGIMIGIRDYSSWSFLTPYVTPSLTPGSWTRISASYTATSANTQWRLTISDPTGITAGSPQFFWVDEVLLEASSTLNPYFDGSTAGATWSGTPNYSISTLNTSGFLAFM